MYPLFPGCICFWLGHPVSAGLDMSRKRLANKSRSWVSFFFQDKFNLIGGKLGSLFFVTNIIAAFSMLVSASIAKRIGNVKVCPITTCPFCTLPNRLSDHGVHSLTISHISSLDSSSFIFEFGNAIPHSSLLHSVHGWSTSFRLSRCSCASK